MASSYAIEQLLKKHKITDYLAARGIHPSNTNGGKAWYCCPLPNHDDSSPSFAVYLDEEVQNFFCYGCKAGGKIIQLKMKLERLGGRRAIEELCEGIDITIDEEFRYFVEALEKQADVTYNYDPESLSLLISRTIYSFLTQVKFEEPYFHKCEKFLQQFDVLIHSFDLETAEQLYDRLPDVLDKQKEIYEQELDQRMAETYRAYSKIGQ